jgi:hypothetical protein
MNNKMTSNSPAARSKAEKRAKALRENLLKRKQQTRARTLSDKEK